MALKFKKGGIWGWTDLVPFSSPLNCLNFSVLNERDEPATGEVTLVICPVRDAYTAANPATETEGQVSLDWATSDGGTRHQAIVNVGRGVIFTLAVHTLKATLANIGGGQVENIPTRKWAASAYFGGGQRGAAPVCVLRFPLLARDEVSAEQLVPNFAAGAHVVRDPPHAVRLRWMGGAGQVLGSTYLGEDDNSRIVIPTGADRVTLQNLNALDLDRARIEFDLAL